MGLGAGGGGRDCVEAGDGVAVTVGVTIGIAVGCGRLQEARTKQRMGRVQIKILIVLIRNR